VSGPTEKLWGARFDKATARSVEAFTSSLAVDIRLLDQDVASIMTAEVQTASPNDSVHALMKQMTEHRIRHVPVVSSDGLHGIVSIGDVVKSRIGELEFERDQLTSYVSNTQ